MSNASISGFDFSTIPLEESDEYEFKSSQVTIPSLKTKIACAVSGFANSGGGYFVAGVDDDGNADGGLKERIGRQSLRDWADQIIHSVEPSPSYQILLLNDSQGRGYINNGHCILVIKIDESHSGPHMAPDNRYYIRAGAHTVRARHFITEAIWAKRHFAKPRITHVFRLKPGYERAIQLGIISLTTSPAIDVEINLSPLGEFLQNSEAYFPLQSPVIDRENPFYFDVSTWHQAEEKFGKDVLLNVKYKDLSNKSYDYESQLNISNSLPPISIGNNQTEEIVKVLKSINQTLKK